MGCSVGRRVVGRSIDTSISDGNRCDAIESKSTAICVSTKCSNGEVQVRHASDSRTLHSPPRFVRTFANLGLSQFKNPESDFVSRICQAQGSVR